ncbi:MAG: helix-turn-helix domain-containing protein [Aeromonadaceae bacterium]
MSEAVGFAAVSGFSRSFKAVTGVSPSEYRERQE